MLEILLAPRGHSVPVDRLTELLWGKEPPQNAAGSLQTFISVLRRNLARRRDVARRLVVTEAEAYRFATELILFDLDRFDELLEQSARQPTRVARASLEQALDLVRGEAFDVESAPALGQILPELRAGIHDKALEELDALEALVAAVAEHAALVRIIDDLQFADPQTIAATSEQEDILASFKRSSPP